MHDKSVGTDASGVPGCKRVKLSQIYSENLSKPEAIREILVGVLLLTLYALAFGGGIRSHGILLIAVTVSFLIVVVTVGAILRSA